jgi:hypothetical protein
MINYEITVNTIKQVKLIKKSPYKIVLAVTGGGTGIFQTLMRSGGASGVLLEGLIPYNQESLARFLGGMPDKACAESTARQMAMAAFQRALVLNGNAGNEVGVGLTCSLVRPGYSEELRSDGTHRKHIIYVASQTHNETYCETLELKDYDRSRECEEDLTADLALQIISRACEIDTNSVGIYPDYSSNSQHNIIDYGPEWKTLPHVITGKISFTTIGKSSDVIFPGSFHPTTDNHKQIAEAAARFTGKQVIWEISIINADKPPIDYISLSKRVQTIPHRNLLLTRAPKFTDKAKLFPNSTFVVGADTWNRICDPKFYPSTGTYEGSVQEALDYIQSRGVKFLIFQRKGNILPPRHKIPPFCTVVPLEEYEDNGNSSTAERMKV